MPRSTVGIDLTADNLFLVLCVQITDRLDRVTGYTEHDQVVPHDLGDGNGSINYQPEASFRRSAIEARDGGRTGSVDLIGMVDSAGITEQDVFGRVYDSALFKMFFVDWTDPSAGRIHIEIGDFEETGVEENRLTVTLKSLLDRYNVTKIGDYYEADCIHGFGSQATDLPLPFGGMGCRVQTDVAAWTASTAVIARAETNAKPPAAGSPDEVNVVKPTTENGFWFEAGGSGTTGGSEPSWPTTLGGTVSDNGITWTARQALRETVALTGFANQRILTVSYSGIADATLWQRGLMIGLAGANAGLSQQVKSVTMESPDDAAIITLWEPFKLPLEIGSPQDTFTMLAGCDRKLETCVNTFRNRDNNMGAAKWAPTTDEVFRIPKST